MVGNKVFIFSVFFHQNPLYFFFIFVFLNFLFVKISQWEPCIIQLGPPHHSVTFSSEEHFHPNLSLDEVSDKVEGGAVDQGAVHTGKSARIKHSPSVQLEYRQDHKDHLVEVSRQITR